MQIFRDVPNYPFMRIRKGVMAMSLILVIISIVSLATRGLNLGLDFTGGTLIEVGYQESADVDKIRAALAQAGFNDATVQNFGSAREVLVRIAPRANLTSAQLSTQILDVLKTTSTQAVDMRRVEFVGPQVGDELVEKGGLALITASAGILLYVWMRFERRLAIGAIAALLHDILVTVGMFSLFQWEFDLTVLAAILAVLGYSINDTIVVYDRLRENFRKLRKATPEEVIDVSTNQTLSRTVMTSFATLLVVIALFFFGGELIHNFALALIIGITFGTYSSVYVASALALVLGLNKQDLMPPEKEGADSKPVM